MSNQYKKGELEAQTILKNNFNIQFDESHHDNGTQNNLPDLKTKDGQYIEVTHTQHAHSLSYKEFSLPTIEESQNLKNALQRFLHNNYEITENGDRQRKQDAQLINKIYGTCPFDKEKRFITNDIDNILKAINIKNDKHKSHDGIDLFIFVSETEMDLLIDFLKTNSPRLLIQKIKDTIFQFVYICQWNFYYQTYNITNPRMFKISDSNIISYNI